MNLFKQWGVLFKFIIVFIVFEKLFLYQSSSRAMELQIMWKRGSELENSERTMQLVKR